MENTQNANLKFSTEGTLASFASFGIIESVNEALRALEADAPETAFWKLLCLSEMLSLSLSYGFTSKTKYARQIADQGVSTMQKRPFMPLQQTETAEMLLKCSELWKNLPSVERPIVSLKVCELSSTQKPILIYVRDREERTICYLSDARRRPIKAIGIGIIFYSRFYKVDPDFDFSQANINLFRSHSTHCFNEPPVDQEFVYMTDSTNDSFLHAHGTNLVLQDSVFLGFVSFAYPTTDYFHPTTRSQDRRLLSVFFDEVDDIVTFKLRETPGGKMDCWKKQETFSVVLHTFRLSDEQPKAMQLENGYVLKRCDDSMPNTLQLFAGKEDAELLGEWKHFSGVETIMHESAGRVGLSAELITTILFDFAGWKGYTSGVEASLADIDTFLENETSQRNEYFYKNSSTYIDFRNTALHVFDEQAKLSKEARDHSPEKEIDETRDADIEPDLSNISMGKPSTTSPTNEAKSTSHTPHALNSGVDTNMECTPPSVSLHSTTQHLHQQKLRYCAPPPRQQNQPSPQQQNQPSPHVMQQNFFQAPQQNQPCLQQFLQQFMQKQAGVTAGMPPTWPQQQQNFHQQQNFQPSMQNFQQFHQPTPTQPNIHQTPNQVTAGGMPNLFGAGSSHSDPSRSASSLGGGPTPSFSFPNQQQFPRTANAPPQMMQSNAPPQMMTMQKQMQQQQMQQQRNQQIFFQQQIMQQHKQFMMQQLQQQQRMNPVQVAQQENMMNQYQHQLNVRQNLINLSQPQVPYMQLSPQQLQAQMGMRFMAAKKPSMSPDERQTFINLQRLIQTPIGQRLLANPQVSTEQILKLIETEPQTTPNPAKHNEKMARAIAARHRENFISTQRDVENFREESGANFVEKEAVEKKEEKSEKDERADMQFEFNADNETLDNLGDSYKDNVALLMKRIAELEALKRSYSGGGFKKMRSVVNNAIRKLRGTLQKLSLEDELEHSTFYPLHKRHRDFTGLEVKFVACPEDCAIVIQDVGFLRVKVRTFGRLACRDTLPRIDKVHGIVRQSRPAYAKKIQKNNVFKTHPNICRCIAEYMYHKLIPLELQILDQKVTYYPQYFPVVWQVYGIMDVTIPDWERRYFQSFQFEQMPDNDLKSNIPLCTIDDAYFQALVQGQEKFVFQIKSNKLKKSV